MTDKAVEDMKNILEAFSEASKELPSKVADDLIANLAKFMDRLTLSDCETFAREVRYVMDDVVRRRVMLKEVDPIKTPEREAAELETMTPYERDVVKMGKLLKVITTNSLFDAKPANEATKAEPKLSVEEVIETAQNLKVDGVNVSVSVDKDASQADLKVIDDVVKTISDEIDALRNKADAIVNNVLGEGVDWLKQAQATVQDKVDALFGDQVVDTNPEPVDSLSDMPEDLVDDYIQARLTELDNAIRSIESALKKDYQDRQDYLNDIRALNERLSQNEKALSAMHLGIQRQLAELTKTLKGR